MTLQQPTAVLIQLSPEQLAALAADAVSEALGQQQQQQQVQGFLRVLEAAAFLGMSEWALRKAEEKGQVPAHRLGGRVLFDPLELREFVLSGKGAT